MSDDEVRAKDIANAERRIVTIYRETIDVLSATSNESAIESLLIILKEVRELEMDLGEIAR